MIAPELVLAGTTVAGLAAASHAFHSWLSERRAERGDRTAMSDLLARYKVTLGAKLDDRMDEMRSVVDVVQASQNSTVQAYVDQSKELKAQRADLEKLMQENFAALANAHNAMGERLQKLEAGSPEVAALTTRIESVRDEREAHEAKLEAALGKLAMDWRQKYGEIEHAIKSAESNVDHKLAATEAAGLPRYKGFNRG